MSLIERLFGKKDKAAAAAPPSSRPPSHLASVMTQQAPATEGTRRELLRVVLRDTLAKHGIPSGWLGAEVLSSTSRTGERGLHWRLVIQHWDPRFVQYAVALQHALLQRVTSFDPMAPEWLGGISWRFALDDESECPAMPESATWTAAAAPAPATSAAAASAAQLFVTSPHIPAVPMPPKEEIPPAPPEDHDVHADLQRLLALRDEDYAKHASEMPTQPMFLPTEPGKF